MMFLILALCFSLAAVVLIPPHCALAQPDADFTSTPIDAREKIVQHPILLIDLHQTEGNFFVLASDIPFEVRKAEPEVSWMEIEPIAEAQTAHRIIPVKSRPEGLPAGTYFSAIHVVLTTSTGEDYILIPVALQVGEEFERGFSQDLSLAAEVPENKIRLHVDDPNIDVRFMMTPGGHYIFEVIDQIIANRRLEQLSESLGVEPKAGLSLSAVTETYEIVLPWMCLEYPCGRSTEDDIADVEPNIDAVNAVSYERYNMSNGYWSNYEDLYNIGNPGPWAIQMGLGTWPMVSGLSSKASIDGMWEARLTIAEKMIAEAKANGYRGYCIDIEGNADPLSIRDTFIDLVDYLADQLHANGLKLMVVSATWGGSFIARIEDLAPTSVDYVATMDPYTHLWYDYIPADYAAIEPHRLIWGFFWGYVSTSEQYQMWQWMEENGYNVGVAGAAGWRTPLDGSQDVNPNNGVDYYQGFRDYYPTGDANQETVIGEVGFIDDSLTHMPQTVMLSRQYQNPVVFVLAPSRDGPNTAVVRITDVSSDRFTLYVHEAPNHDGYHTSEAVSYLVLESGSWELTDGTRLEVGSVKSAATVGRRITNVWETISFSTAFASEPIVFSQVQTYNDAHWVKTRQRNTTTSSFELALEEEEGKSIPHGLETIAWLAIEPGTGSWNGHAYEVAQTADAVIHSWYTISFGQSFGQTPRFLSALATYDGGDSAHLRYNRTSLTADEVKVMVEEDTAWDNEKNHTTERVSYLAIEGDGLLTAYQEEVSQSPFALLAPVAAGQQLYVSHGYNDPLPEEDCNIGGGGADHCDNQRYGLDLVPSDQDDLAILAPLPGRVEWKSGDCLGIRTEDDLNLNICHFGTFEVQVGVQVSRGTMLGMRNTSWIHLSLDDRYRDSSWPPVPFNDEHTIEGESFEPGPDDVRNQHVGRTLTSTNRPNNTDTDCARFVSDLNYFDGTVVSPGETINKGWRLSNCGDTTWSTAGGYQAVRIGGSYGPTSFNIPTVDPGQPGDLYADITVPTTAGTHRATYQLEGPAGTFGDPFWVEIVVQTTTPTIVDDGDSGFVRFGPSRYWHKESIGYGGDMYWTYVNGNVVSNKVQWRPNLSGAGNYRVKAFIPYNYATTRSARYTIRANGTSYTSTVNQNIYYDQWVTLGTFYFNSSNNGSEYVELTDATGEAGSTYLMIGFDAVKWEKQ
jgi:hypothetical protein